MNATAQQARSRTAKTPSRPASARKKAASPSNGRDEHTLTIDIPVGRAASAVAKVAAMPVTAVQRVLPAKGGLPLFLGLGTLGLVGVLEWPVAAGIGIGYAVLRQGGVFGPASASPSNGPDDKTRTASGR
ncbi:hypothetical protein ABT009_40095 [Streptomyces sp. NPDC002896]|uniref:hypothetical protein n=1 Tax=Streptomyces sp. NPDC002896 TaxID=3154438 RepID=UPI003328B82D